LTSRRMSINYSEHILKPPKPGSYTRAHTLKHAYRLSNPRHKTAHTSELTHTYTYTHTHIHNHTPVQCQYDGSLRSVQPAQPVASLHSPVLCAIKRVRVTQAEAYRIRTVLYGKPQDHAAMIARAKIACQSIWIGK